MNNSRISRRVFIRKTSLIAAGTVAGKLAVTGCTPSGSTQPGNTSKMAETSRRIRSAPIAMAGIRFLEGKKVNKEGRLAFGVHRNSRALEHDLTIRVPTTSCTSSRPRNNTSSRPRCAVTKWVGFRTRGKSSRTEC